MFTIVGLGFLLYSLLGSRFPTDFFAEPTTSKQKLINRAFYVAISAFMFAWGVFHLAEMPLGR